MSEPAPVTTTRQAGLIRAYWVCAGTLLCGLGWVLLALVHQDAPWAEAFFLHDGETVLLGFGFALSGLLVLAHRAGPDASPPGLDGPARPVGPTGPGRPGAAAVAGAGVDRAVGPPGLSLGLVLLAAGFGGCLSRFVLLAAAAAGAGPVAEAVGAALLLASVTLFVFLAIALPLWIPGGRLPGGPRAGASWSWWRSGAPAMRAWSGSGCRCPTSATSWCRRGRGCRSTSGGSPWSPGRSSWSA